MLFSSIAINAGKGSLTDTHTDTDKQREREERERERKRTGSLSLLVLFMVFTVRWLDTFKCRFIVYRRAYLIMT